MSDYYAVSGVPSTGASLDSAVIRSEFLAISAGFDKLPDLTGVANRVVHANAGSTALTTTSGFTFDGTTLTTPGLSVTDSTFSIKDNSDATKIAQFQCSGITTATTRTYSAPDKNGTMALLGDIPPPLNRYANGDFSIDQVNEGAAVTFAGGTTGHAQDCCRGSATGAGTFTMTRVADPDNANNFALKFACTVADASIGATDAYYSLHQIEGYDVADFNFGLASAETLTISLDMRMDVTGTYGISVTNSAQNRTYVGVVTQNVASTWESKTLTLVADTTGTWPATNGIGMRVRLCLAAGSDFQGTASTWSATNYLTTSAQANFMSVNTNVGYIRNLQVEKGASASAFERRSFSERIWRLQRYYEKSFDLGTAVAQNAGYAGALMYKVQIAGTTAGYAITIPFAAQKRAIPTMTGYNGGAANANFRNVDGGADSGTPNFNQQNFGSFVVINPQAAGDAASNRCYLQWTADARLA